MTTINTGIRADTTTVRVTMELRMSNKECREWASEAEEETAAAVPRTTTAAAAHLRRTAAAYPSQTNITSSRRKLPKR